MIKRFRTPGATAYYSVDSRPSTEFALEEADELLLLLLLQLEVASCIIKRSGGVLWLELTYSVPAA